MRVFRTTLMRYLVKPAMYYGSCCLPDKPRQLLVWRNIEISLVEDLHYVESQIIKWIHERLNGITRWWNYKFKVDLGFQLALDSLTCAGFKLLIIVHGKIDIKCNWYKIIARVCLATHVSIYVLVWYSISTFRLSIQKLCNSCLHQEIFIHWKSSKSVIVQGFTDNLIHLVLSRATIPSPIFNNFFLMF